MKGSLVFLALLTAWNFFGAAAEPPAISSADHILKPLVGKQVTVEGLAWGAMSKGLGERVVLPSGIPFYFTGGKYREQHKNGRTVRVVGRLKIETMEPAPEGAQGYTDRFQYYALEVESIQVIEEVREEFPVLVKKQE